MEKCAARLKKLQKRVGNKEGRQKLDLTSYEYSLIISTLYFWIENPEGSTRQELRDIKALLKRLP
jgi:hypothetical protein